MSKATSYPLLDKTVTDLCIEFDNEINKPNRDDTKLYIDLYNIIIRLAMKANYFPNKSELYDEFALYATTTVYMRCIDPRRGHYNGKGRELKPIKSIRNYVNNTLDGLRTDYQQIEYSQIIDPNEYSFINGDKIKAGMERSVREDYTNNIRLSVETDIRNISNYIKNLIKLSPYCDDPVVCKNLYQSCILSLINSFTLKNAVVQSMKNRDKKCAVTDYWLISLFHQERKNSTILWGLDESMKDYVTLLVNMVRVRLANNIDASRNTYEVSNNIMKAIIMSEYNTYQPEENN